MRLGLLLACILLGRSRAHFATAAETSRAGIVEVFPRELTNTLLHNPGMGWVLYENYPVDQDPNGSSTMVTLPDEPFPEAGEVAVMFTWQDVEKEQGQYDFSKVDHACDYWRQRGKAIQLRMSSESLVWWANRNPPTGLGVPAYVVARLNALEKQTRTIEGQSYLVVNARNRFYQKRLAAFLHAVNDHFDEHRPVTLIDLRGFGVWGEWHSGFRYENLNARRSALKSVLDIWSKQLPQRKLALSFSYDPDGPPEFYAGPNNRFAPEFTTTFARFLRYSGFDYALQLSNVSWRRDGCGGAVHSNERKLDEQAFLKFHRAPISCEFLGGYASARKGGTNWVNWMIDDALSLHPNYVNLLGWQGSDARTFIRERPDLVRHGLLRMGYRFAPTKIRFPSHIQSGKEFPIEFEWVNRGVGRALNDFELHLALIEPQTGSMIESKPARMRTSEWVAGNTYAVNCRGRFESHNHGAADLLFYLYDPGTRRRIALALEQHDHDRVYPIGKTCL